MDWVSVLVIIGVVFFAIMMFISIWYASTSIIVLYFVWAVFIIAGGSIWQKNENDNKVLFATIFLTILFIYFFNSEFQPEVVFRTFTNDPMMRIVLEPFTDKSMKVYTSIGMSVASAFVFGFIGNCISTSRGRYKEKKINDWVKQINEYYNTKIKGINEVINLIKNIYLVENKIEKLLALLDICTGGELKIYFGKKELDNKKELIFQIGDILSRYSIDIELENKTLSNIISELEALKSEYEGKIYSEEQEDLSLYNEIKKEYKLLCKKGNIK